MEIEEIIIVLENGWRIPIRRNRSLIFECKLDKESVKKLRDLFEKESKQDSHEGRISSTIWKAVESSIITDPLGNRVTKKTHRISWEPFPYERTSVLRPYIEPIESELHKNK